MWEISLLLSLLLISGVHASDPSKRTLLATDSSSEYKSPYYLATNYGGLFLASNYTITTDGIGRVTAGRYNTSSSGYITVLSRSIVTRSDVFINAGCMEVSLKTTSRGVVAFLSTYSDYLAMYSNRGYNVRAATVVGSANLSSSKPGPVRVPTDPSDQYTLVIYSLDRQDQVVKYQINAFAADTPECSSASPARAPESLTSRNAANNTLRARSPTATPPQRTTLPSQNSAVAPSDSAAAAPSDGIAAAPLESTAAAPVESTAAAPSGAGRRLLQSSGRFGAPAPGPASSLTQTVQVSKRALAPDATLFLATAVTNASCVAYKLIGQPKSVTRSSRIDLSVMIMNERNLQSWASQGFVLQNRRNVSFLATCLQNNTAPGDCGSYANNLNKTDKYFVVAVTGMQRPRSVSDEVLVIMAATAQADGSCANNAIQNFKDSTSYFSSTSEDYGDYGEYNDYDSGFGSGSGSGSGGSGSSVLGALFAPPPPAPTSSSFGSGSGLSSGSSSNSSSISGSESGSGQGTESGGGNGGGLSSNGAAPSGGIMSLGQGNGTSLGLFPLPG